MANSLTGNPWICDTASATPITRLQVRIAKLRWIGTAATAAGDRCIVKDARATPRIIWESIATGANFTTDSDAFGSEGNFNGLAVTTLGSGLLYIYYA